MRRGAFLCNSSDTTKFQLEFMIRTSSKNELFRAYEVPVSTINLLWWRWRLSKDRVKLLFHSFLLNCQTCLDCWKFIWTFYQSLHEVYWAETRELWTTFMNALVINRSLLDVFLFFIFFLEIARTAWGLHLQQFSYLLLDKLLCGLKLSNTLMLAQCSVIVQHLRNWRRLQDVESGNVLPTQQINVTEHVSRQNGN